MGKSWGGAVALEAAMKSPSVVSKLILSAPAYRELNKLSELKLIPSDVADAISASKQAMAQAAGNMQGSKRHVEEQYEEIFRVDGRREPSDEPRPQGTYLVPRTYVPFRAPWEASRPGPGLVLYRRRAQE